MMSLPNADELISNLLAKRPILHDDYAGRLVDFGIDPRLVRFLRAAITPSCRTIETGSGISTLVFLILGAKHTAVSPDAGEPKRIGTYCQAHGIPIENYSPITGFSENVLPGLTIDVPVDVALVDGSHSFPLPCIDWFYLTRALRKGGTMILDDINLWSGKIIADFLDADDAWEMVVRNDRFAGYRLLIPSEEVLLRWWGQQPYVVKQMHPSGPIKRFLRVFLPKR
jgi:Methyltransferase domain